MTGAGFLMLGLGGIGLIVPVWPTTPFVLVAAACFSGNPAMRERLSRNRFFRAHIENYRTRGGLSKRTVAASLTFLWGMLALSALIVRNPWLWALFFVVGAFVTVHLAFMARPGKKRG
ncbi:MAG: YbaN family protein [Clostridia bacterium]